MNNTMRAILLLVIFVVVFALVVAIGFYLDRNSGIRSAMPFMGDDYLTAWRYWKYVSGIIAAIAALLSYFATRPKGASR